jgi:hypothetical protein
VENGIFYATKQELLEHLTGNDKEVLEMTIQLKHNQEFDFDCAYNLLFSWCQKAIIELK